MIKFNKKEVKMNKRKIFLLITIVISFAIVISSCSKKQKKGVPITLAFWGSTEEIEIIKNTVEPWDEKRDDLYVILQHVPIGGDTSRYVQRLLTQIAGGDAPDVIFMEVNIFVDFYFKDVLMDLTPFIKKDKEFDIKDFYPDVVRRFTREGKIYVIPRDTAPFNCVYYNKDLFDKEGLEYPKNDWTWNDLVRIGKKLTKKNEQGIVTQYGFWTWCMMNFIYSAGGGFVDNINNPQRCILNLPASKEGLQFYHDLMWKYHISPRPGAMDMGGLEMFETGKLAMYGSGIWETPRLRKITTFDWDIVPFPRHPKKGLKTGTGGSGYAILKTTKYPDKAWELVKCLAGDYGQAILGDTGLAQPARISIAASKHFAYDGKKPKNKAILLESVKNVVYEPFHPNWNEINRKYIGPELDLYNLNKQTLDEALEKIVLNVNKALQSEKVSK